MLLKRLLEPIARWESRLAARWVSSAHARLLAVQWGLKPWPEHFDHRIDLFHQWIRTRNPTWVERGVFSLLALKGGPVLELSCGDGFNARNFYSLRAASVIACDIDSRAIVTARRHNRADNLQYVVADIRTDMPQGEFDNVVWDFAFPLTRYFKPAEIERILAQIKRRLAGRGGILSGYTEAETGAVDGDAYQFRCMADLQRFLRGHFANVTVFETRAPQRHNMYFWASDATVPFQEGWHAALVVAGGSVEPGRRTEGSCQGTPPDEAWRSGGG